MIIKLELTVDEVNYILNDLANKPYIEVVELIEKIRTEGEKQFNEQNNTTEE